MNANKIILYVILIFLYLGLSKSLSPSELGISYVNNQESLAELVRGAPLSVILTDTHSTGFIIKTYYHKYRIVYGFQTYEELIVRVSRSFMAEHLKSIGMSIMRRDSDNNNNFTVLPPGSVFIGDRSFGNWQYDKNSKQKSWKFHRAYRHLPRYLGIQEFTITEKFFNEVSSAKKAGSTFLGFNDEFGVDGSITKKSFPNYFNKKEKSQIDIKEYLKNYFKRNFYSTKK